jgi:hypothetical protein
MYLTGRVNVAVCDVVYFVLIGLVYVDFVTRTVSIWSMAAVYGLRGWVFWEINTDFSDILQ